MNLSSEDYDFSPTGSSNLRSLFDHSSEVSESSSLLYTAPKQPKVGTAEVKTVEVSKPETSVICARVVQVWKLVEGKYNVEGKHGCAIIGSSTQTSYEMILYKEKNNVIMRSKIGANFNVSLQKDNFVSFYDNSNENWLIKFNTNDDCIAILNNIEKYNGKVTTTKNNIPPEEQDTVRNVDPNPENKTRADILSRIAKMGQSILPNKSSDLEENIVETIHANDSPHLSKTEAGPLSMLPQTNLMQTQRPIQNASNTFIVSQPIPYDPLNVYISENRTQNSEVRMNLSQISEKLNCIMKLVDTGNLHSDSDNGTLKSKIKVMELKMENLLRELSAVQEENAKLKQDKLEYNHVLKNQEQYEEELKVIKEQKAAEIEDLQNQIAVHKNRADGLSDEVETQIAEISKLKEEILISSKEDLKLKTESERLEKTVLELQNQLESQQKQNVSSPENDNQLNFTTSLKEEMNGMYANIMANIDQESVSEVNGIIAQNIKLTTLQIIQNFQKLYGINQETKK